MSQEKSLLNDMLTQLDTMVGKSRIWLKTFEEIGLKAEELRSLSFDSAFGIFQIMAFNSLATEVYNIFDDDKNNSIISIPSILKELEQDSYTLHKPEHYRDALAWLKARLPEEDAELKSKTIAELNKLRPNFKNNEILEKICHVRNNFIPHKNQIHVIGSKSHSLPTSQEFAGLFEWADNFRKAIYIGYLPGYSPPDMEEWALEQTSSVTKLIDFVIGSKEKIFSDLLNQDFTL